MSNLKSAHHDAHTRAVMPATATMSTAIEVSAAAYWSLRLDRDFDLFCAVKDGASFTLHSESEECLSADV